MAYIDDTGGTMTGSLHFATDETGVTFSNQGAIWDSGTSKTCIRANNSHLTVLSGDGQRQIFTVNEADSYPYFKGEPLQGLTAGVLRTTHLPTDLAARRDMKQSLGLPLTFDDYGLYAASSMATANVPLFNSMIADLRARGLNEVVVTGAYYFASELLIPFGLTIRGVHMSHSVIGATHTGNVIRFTGEYGTGGGLKDLSVGYLLNGGTGNVAIYAIASSAGYSPDFLHIERVNITGWGGSTMYYGIILEGDSRAPTSGLQGIRDIVIRDVQSFNVINGNNFEVRHGRGIEVDNFQCFTAQGNRASVYVRGKNSTFKNSGVYLSKIIAASLIFENTDQFTLQGYAMGGWSILSNCVSGKVYGVGGAGVTNYASANGVVVT